MRPVIPWLIAATLLAVSNAPSAENTSILQREGTAYDRDTDAVLYTIHHTRYFADGRLDRAVVEYRDDSGTTFARKRLQYTPGRPYRPAFRLSDERTGHLEAVAIEGDQATIRFRKDRSTSLKSKTVELPADGIIDAGFRPFIEDHWAQLTGDETLRRPFLVPSRLSFLKLRLRQVDTERSGGETRPVFEMDSSSFFIRLFAPTLRMVFATDPRELRVYEGVSALRDANGDSYKVRVRFDSWEPVSGTAMAPARTGGFAGAAARAD